MGLPLSSDSRTASSRDRSWISRAMRYRYLARSAGAIFPQTSSCARRAAATARSTSPEPPSPARPQHLLGGRVARLHGLAVNRVGELPVDEQPVRRPDGDDGS